MILGGMWFLPLEELGRLLSLHAAIFRAILADWPILGLLNNSLFDLFHQSIAFHEIH